MRAALAAEGTCAFGEGAFLDDRVPCPAGIAAPGPAGVHRTAFRTGEGGRFLGHGEDIAESGGGVQTGDGARAGRGSPPPAGIFGKEK